MMDKVQTAAARAILPVYCTNPKAALLRESGLSPSEITLDNITRKYSIRTRRLDPYHPLYYRSHKANISPALTRISRSLQDILISEELDPLLYPPWERYLVKNISSQQIHENSDQFTRITTSFQQILQEILQSDITVYSDGSKQTNSDVGCGYIVSQAGRKLCSGARPLRRYNEIYDGELQAALDGIRAAVALPTTRFVTDLWLFLDNKEVIQNLTSPIKIKSSQSAHIKF